MDTAVSMAVLAKALLEPFSRKGVLKVGRDKVATS